MPSPPTSLASYEIQIAQASFELPILLPPPHESNQGKLLKKKNFPVAIKFHTTGPSPNTASIPEVPALSIPGRGVGDTDLTSKQSSVRSVPA